MFKILIGIIDFLFAVLIVGLVLRFVLKILGANSSSSFVAFLYDNTAPFLAPFSNVFRDYVFTGGAGRIEFSALLAITVYIIAAFLITEIFFRMDKALSDDDKRAR